MVPTLKCTHSRKYLFTLFLAKRTLDFSIIYYWLLILHSFEISLTLSRTETHSQSSTRDHQKNEICTTIKHARSSLSSRLVPSLSTTHRWWTTAQFCVCCTFALCYFMFCLLAYDILLLFLFAAACLHTTQWNEKPRKSVAFFFCCIGRNSRL